MSGSFLEARFFINLCVESLVVAEHLEKSERAGIKTVVGGSREPEGIRCCSVEAGLTFLEFALAYSRLWASGWALLNVPQPCDIASLPRRRCRVEIMINHWLYPYRAAMTK